MADENSSMDISKLTKKDIAKKIKRVKDIWVEQGLDKRIGPISEIKRNREWLDLTFESYYFQGSDFRLLNDLFDGFTTFSVMDWKNKLTISIHLKVIV